MSAEIIRFVFLVVEMLLKCRKRYAIKISRKKAKCKKKAIKGFIQIQKLKKFSLMVLW